MGFLDSILSQAEQKISAFDATRPTSANQAENVAIELPDFAHDSDRAALQALASIPAFGKILQSYGKLFSDKERRLQYLSTMLQVGPKQCPEIYRLIPGICEFFAASEPEVFVEMSPLPNAYTEGFDNHRIVITTGLLDMVTEAELEATLAHEIAHIACSHVLYHTIGRMIGDGMMAQVISRIPGINLAMLAADGVKGAFNYWSRCSELTADRAAVLYFGNTEPMTNLIMKLAGGNSRFVTLDVEQYMRQGEMYLAEVKTSKISKAYHYSDVLRADHPLHPVRIYELNKWIETEEFIRCTERYASGFSSRLRQQIQAAEVCAIAA